MFVKKLIMVAVAGATLVGPVTAQDVRFIAFEDLLRSAELQLAASAYKVDMMASTPLQAESMLSAAGLVLDAYHGVFNAAFSRHLRADMQHITGAADFLQIGHINKTYGKNTHQSQDAHHNNQCHTVATSSCEL